MKAMLESSVLLLWSGSSAYTIGWFGTLEIISSGITLLLLLLPVVVVPKVTWKRADATRPLAAAISPATSRL